MRSTLLSSAATTMKTAVTWTAYNGLVSDEWSQYTHDEYCDMLVTLGSCKNPSSINAREYALRHPVHVIKSLMCFDAVSMWQ